MSTGSVSVSSHFSHQMPESCPLGFLYHNQAVSQRELQTVHSPNVTLPEGRQMTKMDPLMH